MFRIIGTGAQTAVPLTPKCVRGNTSRIQRVLERQLIWSSKRMIAYCKVRLARLDCTQEFTCCTLHFSCLSRLMAYSTNTQLPSITTDSSPQIPFLCLFPFTGSFCLFFSPYDAFVAQKCMFLSLQARQQHDSLKTMTLKFYVISSSTCIKCVRAWIQSLVTVEYTVSYNVRVVFYWMSKCFLG